MKKNILVLTLCLIFLAFTQVHAAIYWDGEYQQFYYELGNPKLGTFYQVTPDYFDADIGQQVSKDEGNPAAFADGISRIHRPLLGSPDYVNDNLIKFKAGAKGPDGGVNPENSVQVKGYAEILLHNDFDCQNHGVDLEQSVHTHINRKFSVDDGTYSINAWMEGTGVFTEIPDISGNHFAEYDIEGSARLTGFINGDTLIPLGELLSFNFDEVGTGSEDIELSSLSEDGDPIYYVLSVGLDLDAILRNAWNDEITSPSDAANFESSSLGTIESPFEVGATLTETTPIPIPGSLVLLLSGLGGLSVIGRRFKRS